MSSTDTRTPAPAATRTRRRSSRPQIERASPVDLMELATDRAGSPNQVAAVLVLDSQAPFAAVRDAIAKRVRAVPRFHQRLLPAPFGCGRPYWADDPTFDIDRHVQAVRCTAPGDERALLDIAAMVVTTPLSGDRPLWSVSYVTGLSGGRSGLIVAFHHLLTDGIGGLAVLAHLVDGALVAPPAEGARPRPSRGQLLVDAVTARLRAAARLPALARDTRAAMAELDPRAVTQAPRCSLNQPTGRRRRFAVARADLSATRAVAHAQHGTVNDVVLAAVTGALHSLLRHRGEVLDRVVVSMPVSARRTTTVSQLGNRVGVLPVELPATGDAQRRLEAVAATTRERKTSAPGASAALLAPAFRLLARFGVLRWYINRQRRVTTFVSNVPGPATRLSFLGMDVVDAIPISVTTGNVTVAFAVLSYAGTLVVTVVADPERCPDLRLLVGNLQHELDVLTVTTVPERASARA